MIDSITEMTAEQQAIELAQLKHDHLLAELTANVQLADAKLGLEYEEAQVTIEVCEAQGPDDGKLLYSNAERRAVEIKCRMGIDDDLVKLQNRIGLLKEQAGRSRIDATYAGDRLKIVLAFAGGER